ncbi:hypothetical protein DPMN_137968 [Dreissena polymorpha]|uniref:Uncharacterized protein n=1 Tax=Dreissena polymorpha TaxID=45954 RepID=A0A9D4G5Q4_DREPO|nr:hypothetical protein DPMN_137968 [Dreissena polymorpha]
MSERGKPAGRKRKAQTKLPENQETGLHEDWTSNVTSKVFTRFFFFDLHDPVSNSTKLSFRKNCLIKFHADQTIYVATKVFTRQNVDDEIRTTNEGQKVIPKAHHEHVVLR